MKRQKQFCIVCGKKVDFYPESRRKEMADFYLEGSVCCDGSESERYTNIYADLIIGKKICRDVPEDIYTQKQEAL